MNEIANCYIFENAKAKKDKMLGKLVGIKERTLTFDLENQYGSRFP
jgi:hypothetical protein